MDIIDVHFQNCKENKKDLGEIFEFGTEIKIAELEIKNEEQLKMNPRIREAEPELELCYQRIKRKVNRSILSKLTHQLINQCIKLTILDLEL